MRARGTITLAAVIGIFAMAALFYGGLNQPKEEKLSINVPIHGTGIIFGSPKYQVKGELVEGGFLDNPQPDVAPTEGAQANTPRQQRQTGNIVISLWQLRQLGRLY